MCLPTTSPHTPPLHFLSPRPFLPFLFSLRITTPQHLPHPLLPLQRLFEYISGANLELKRINMTAPVRVLVTPGAGPFCEDHFKISFYVPPALQEGGVWGG